MILEGYVADDGHLGDEGTVLKSTAGWVIDGGVKSHIDELVDAADANALYRLLEEEIVPRYYRRDEDGMPLEWVALMRRAIATSIWRFSSTRMLHEYTEQLYLPAAGIEADRTVEARSS